MNPLAEYILQWIFFIVISPVVPGTLRWCKARLQGRTGPSIIQPYLDLVKLFRCTPVIPATTSWVFRIAPMVIFCCYLLIGFLTPILFYPATTAGNIQQTTLIPYPDLIALIYILALARFMICLAGMDTASPFASLGSSREMFMQFLAEPALFLIIFTLTLSPRSTSLAEIMNHYRNISLIDELALILVFFALCIVIFIECGRIPFNNPDTHLELTMTYQGIYLEYGGPHLALLEWVEAMRLTFFMTLLFNIFFRYIFLKLELVVFIVPVGLLLYLVTLLFLIITLAGWEMTRPRIRLRDTIIPSGIAIGMSLLAAIIMVIKNMFLN